jgi:SAM-dependent methyltransferase
MMQSLEPVAADTRTAMEMPYAGASATALAEVLERLPRHIGGRLPGNAMIVMPTSAAPPISGTWAVYRLPNGTGGALEQKTALPFVDAAFDTVCVYATILDPVRHRSLLKAIAPILKPGGVVLVVEPTDNFKFAPFPVGGPGHLVRRYLLEAGFRDVRALPGSDRLLVFVARRE